MSTEEKNYTEQWKSNLGDGAIKKWESAEEVLTESGNSPFAI